MTPFPHVGGGIFTTTEVGRIRAPGPGRPLVVLIVFDVVAGSQKTETTVPFAVFGKSGVFQGGLTGMGTPVRTTPGVCAVGKHGLVESVEQQNWLMPPLASRHCPSGVLLAHASPEHVTLHRPPPHWSSCTGTPTEGSPGLARQGCGPLQTAIPEVRGRRIPRVPANWKVPLSGGQSRLTG